MRKPKQILKQQLMGGIATVWSERGASLVESLVAVALLGTVIISLLVALSTGAIAVGTVDERVTAENLARSQMEYTKQSPYTPAPFDYSTITPPAGYSITAQATSIPDTDDKIQKIRVTIYRDGEALLVLEDFKVNR